MHFSLFSYVTEKNVSTIYIISDIAYELLL